MIALAALLVLAPPHARAQQAPPTYRSTVSAEGPALEARAQWLDELDDAAFDAPPVPHWVASLPRGRSSSANQTERARPVVSRDLVFAGGSTVAALHAYDRARGTLVRRYPAAASVDAAPLAVGEFVFFADSGGHVWAYERGGRKLWSYDAGAPILTTPTLTDGLLVVATVDDLVVALDTVTGTQSWRYRHRGELGRKVDLALYAAPRPIVSGNDVLVGFADGSLVALGTTTGDVTWQASVGAGRYPDLVADPLAWGGLVFASGYDEPLVALDPSSRQVAWTLPYGSAAAPTLLPADPEAGRDEALLVHPGTDGRLRAVAARGGTERWSWDSGDGASLTEAVLTPAGLVVGSANGTVVLVDPATGKARWRFRPPFLLDGLSAAPTVAGRQLVFVTNAGRMYSLVVPLRDPPMPAPEVVDRR
jgi:outer membrane protein assembly factor BamB